MLVNRDEFLQSLESASPGVATKDVIEQSTCFVFSDGFVTTFDDEICVRVPSKLPKDWSAAVPAKPLLEQLRRWKEDEIDVESAAGGLEVKGKGSRKAFFVAEKDITLPVEHVERPDWSKASKVEQEFGEAIKAVSTCAKDRDENMNLCSISIHPDYVQACDNDQLARWKVKTGVSSFVLARKEALKHLPSLDPTEFAETPGWLHWRNPAGVEFSVRKTIPPEDFPDYGPFLNKEGEPVVLPKGLAEAADKAAVFTSEDKDNDLVRVDLKPGRLRIRGQGPSGRYEECPKVNYNGRELSFMVSPRLLAELVNRHHEALVSEKKLLIDCGRFRSAICLEVVNGKGGGE